MFVLSIQFEESLISHKMAQMGDESEDETPDNEEDDGKNFLLSDDGKDIDLRSAFAFAFCASQLCWSARETTCNTSCSCLGLGNAVQLSN